jgi:hypothetical protein
VQLLFDNKSKKYIHKLFLFKNKETDKISNYFSITNQFIWRRDEFKLVLHTLDGNVHANWNYNLEDLDKIFQTDSANVSEDGVIQIKDDELGEEIHPVDVPLLPNSLNILKTKEYHSELDMSSLFIVRQIAIMQKKLFTGHLSEDSATVILDLKNKQIYLKEFAADKMNLECTFIKQSGPELVFYPFSAFKELLAHSKHFNKSIRLKIFQPYFTLFHYNNKLISILNHKRDTLN